VTSPFDLTGKRALVTGANTGIGQGIAVSLAQAGAEILAVGRSSMAETATKVEAAAGRMIAISANLGDAGAAAQVLDGAWDEHGPIDILVNNAGIIRRADAVDYAEADWDAVMEINLKAVFLLCQAFGRRVLAGKRRGKIINVASLLSFQGGIRVAAYTASKSGVAGITKLLANEWAAKGINVNAIAPGYIETNNTEALRNDPERSADILKRIPAGRWGRPEDIGGTAVYLASSAADYVHGTVLAVDGGWLGR
jgi:2-dehydro-3-deoxy-D-gluconate 5-dehydrogenase